MVDFKTVTETFLDFVYANDILPNEIVSFLEKYGAERDFRLVCDLLFYKERFEKDSNDPHRADLYKELTLRARSLQNVNVWRDPLSLLNLNYLVKIRNIDVHSGVKLKIGTIKDLVKQLIENTEMQNCKEYISRLDDIDHVDVPKDINLGVFVNNVGNMLNTSVENLRIGDKLDHITLNKMFGISYQRGMHFEKGVILWGTNSKFNNFEKDGVLHYFGHNIMNDHSGQYDQAEERENARFCSAIYRFKNGDRAVRFRIFKKEMLWVYMGKYDLIDVIYRQSGNPRDINPNRKVFEFLLKKVDNQ